MSSSDSDDDSGSSGDTVGDPPSNKQLGCAYPTGGNVGVAQNQIVPATHSWRGYAPGNDQPVDINISDFFDCDGSRGVDAVVIDTSQFF